MKELSLYILDIVNNSTRANATAVEIIVHENEENDRLYININDNGSGIPATELVKVCDPYYTSRKTRKVGMGIPLLRMSAEACEGVLSISSEVGTGTQLHVSYQLSHIDRPAMGDIAGVLYLLTTTCDNCEFNYIHHTSAGEFLYNSREVKEMMEGLPLQHPEVMKEIKRYIRDGLQQIKARS
ncbi:MAG: ATP-binding protein [Bacteroidales bacterium]|jgi:hypothetical protein|nr:ATP-binding protein [Bacteroidales bacterium]